MNMLVIGNGFDLALGLPTKYKDFLDFTYVMDKVYIRRGKICGKNELEYDNGFYRIISELQGEKTKEKLSQLAPFFKKFQKAFNDELTDRAFTDFHYCTCKNIWIKYFQEKYDNNSLVGENWIDFEQEMKKVVQLFEDDAFDTSDHLEKTNEENYIKKIDIFNIISKLYPIKREGKKRVLSAGAYNKFREILRKEFDKFVMALGIYLDYFVPKYEHDEEKSSDIERIIKSKKSKPDCILNFNYVNNYYRKYVEEQEKTSNTCYIHGAVNYVDKAKKNILSIKQLIEKNNMIIGFDEYLDDDKKNDKLDFVYYRKFFQRISKGTGSQYLDWLDEYKTRIKNKPVSPSNGETREEVYSRMILQEAKKKPNHVYIFGHSLDATDKDIFRDLFLREPNDTKITIYYHNEDAHERIIANLIRMMTQEVLIKKTHGIDPDIEFIAQTNDSDVNK